MSKEKEIAKAAYLAALGIDSNNELVKTGEYKQKEEAFERWWDNRKTATIKVYVDGNNSYVRNNFVSYNIDPSSYSNWSLPRTCINTNPTKEGRLASVEISLNKVHLATMLMKVADLSDENKDVLLTMLNIKH